MGDYHQGNANKLISLRVAESVGLCIPSTYVSSDKSEILNFHSKNHNVITKFIQDVIFLNPQGMLLRSTTERVSKADITKMDNIFSPSLIQTEIKKKYEIRVFYLQGECYAMAIFSQQDKQTRVDYRNYNHQCPNRMVPYILPRAIELKINRFMKKMNLDTGSIDMIVTPELEYVFLEVNPVLRRGHQRLGREQRENNHGEPPAVLQREDGSGGGAPPEHGEECRPDCGAQPRAYR